MKSVLVFLGIYLAGCGPLAPNQERLSAKADRYGNTIFSDTAHNRALLLLGYDIDIDQERQGIPVQKADASWQSHWLYILASLNRRGAGGKYLTEHHEFYINYIITKRREAGLPDLPGYPR